MIIRLEIADGADSDKVINAFCDSYGLTLDLQEDALSAAEQKKAFLVSCLIGHMQNITKSHLARQIEAPAITQAQDS